MTKGILLTAALAVALGATLTACGKKSKGAGNFRSVTVTKGPIKLTVKTTGTAQPENRLEVKPPVAGRIEKVLVVEGQYVRKGQVLALLSSSERAALLDAARADGPAAVAHWEDLYKATPILAPMNGQVINLEVDPGQTVGVGDVVVAMSDHLIVNAQVDETDIGKVKNGLKAQLTLDAYPDKTFPGKVSQIRYEAITVNNVTMYNVYVLPVKVPGFMRSGMSADVEFTVDSKEDALLLPTEAIKTENGQSYVLVADPANKKPKHVEIQTGLVDGKQTEITDGLQEGDQVLVAVFNSGSKSGATANPFMPGGRPATGGGGRPSGGGGGRP